MKNHTTKIALIILSLLVSACGSQQAPATVVAGEQVRNCASAQASQVDASGRPLCPLSR